MAALATELKMQLWNRSDGSAKCMITEVQKDPKKILNARDYEYRYMQYLKKLREYKRIDIIINSRGGAADSAVGLMGALYRVRKYNPRILIDGICASAATYIACGFKKKRVPVYITEGSKYYIHMPKQHVFSRRRGGPWEMISRAGSKARIRDMAKMYAGRTGQPKKKILEWMEQGKYFSAEEAVAVGFCDGIMSRNEFERGGK